MRTVEWDERFIRNHNLDTSEIGDACHLLLTEVERLRVEVAVRDEALMACLRDGDRVREIIEHEREARHG